MSLVGDIIKESRHNTNMAIDMDLKYMETEDDFDHYDYNFEHYCPNV